MAQGPDPLLRLDPPGRPVKRTTGVRLTDTGARVLAGQADQIALNGIDRWIGGVHLTSAGARVLAGQADQIALNGTDRWIGGVHLHGHHVPWRWDDGTETIVELAG